MVQATGISPAVEADIVASYAALSSQPGATFKIVHLYFPVVARASHKGRSAVETPVHNVPDGILEGARQTGVATPYLTRIAWRESALNPYARARTSTGAGLFQFLDGTWLETIKRYGAAAGMSAAAAAIEQGPRGFTVKDLTVREQILALRYDPAVSTTMAGLLTREHAHYLRDVLGRPANAGELYVAHVLGPRGATDLIRAAYSSPYIPAARLFPKAAAANPALFYTRGFVRSAVSLYVLLLNKGET